MADHTRLATRPARLDLPGLSPPGAAGLTCPATGRDPAPRRHQLRRTRGWRKPAGVVSVARPTRWGNPYRIGDPDPDRPNTLIGDRARAVELYRRRHLTAHPELATQARAQLGGADLACWCPLDQPCHADVLLEIANPALLDAPGQSHSSAESARPNARQRPRDAAR